MAEGQGNGNDPERDSSWRPAPGDGGTPEAGTDPGAGPGSGEPGTAEYPAQQTRPPGGPPSPWQAQPGSQPSWGGPQPWMPPGDQAGYGTPPGPSAGQPPYGQPQPGGQPPYGQGQPPYGQAQYPGQPYGRPPYGDQAAWQPHPGAGPVPPLPGELPGAVPPGGEGHWAPSGGYGGQPPFGPPPSRGRMSRALVYIVVAVLAAAVGAGAVFALRGGAGPAPANSAASRDIPQPRPNHGAGGATAGINPAAVAKKVEPGLVDIVSYVHLQQQVFEGTGMVLSANGLVLTNNHVIKGSTRVVVHLVTSHKSYLAQVVGTDNSQDVALLRLVGARGLKTIQVGNSAGVKVTTPVVALGNAGGNGGLPTVTSGTITNTNRTIQASDAGSRSTETLHNMFQTNAPIAEGDSGGALANSAGQVIAMNTAANSQSLGGPGTSQGFSIPINRALAIARQMAAGHASATIQLGQPAFLGIAIATTSSGGTSNATSPRAQLRQFEAIAQSSFGAVNSSGRCLPNANVNPVPGNIAPARSGALIGAVFCNEPATRAGVQAGDVITAVDGHAVTSAASLHSVIRGYRPGQAVTLTVVVPNGQQQHLSFKLGAGPAA